MALGSAIRRELSGVGDISVDDLAMVDDFDENADILSLMNENDVVSDPIPIFEKLGDF